MTRQRETVLVILLGPATHGGPRHQTEYARIHLKNILGWIDGMNGRVALLKSLQQYGSRQEVIVHPLKRGSSPQVVDLADMIIDPNGEFAEERASIPYDMVVKGETARLSRNEFHELHPELQRITVFVAEF
jgi:hypothetical protein